MATGIRAFCLAFFKKKSMKPFFIFLLLLSSFQGFAQNELPEQFLGFSVWSQRMDLSQYIGKKYRLTMAIRAEPSDGESAAFGFIRNEYPKMAARNWTFMDNMNDRPVMSKNWDTYTLESTVDKKAPWLGFGFLNLGNGAFYYDDLHLSVETEPGVWSPIPIENGGFENETLAPWQQTSMGLPVRVYGAKAEVFSENPFEGKQCLRVTNRLLVKN